MDYTNLVDSQKVKDMFFRGELRNETDFKEATRGMFKSMLQTMLQAEMEEHLGYEKHDYENKKTTNSRNGNSKKSIRTDSFGKIELEIPRDREGEFDSNLIPKHSRVLGGMEDQIISMYSKGMTVRDIESHIYDIYGMKLSPGTVSNITDKVFPLIKEWQQRPLKSVYAFVFLDAIHYNVRQDGAIVNKAAYVVIGINLEGKKDVLGLYVGENESSKYWLGVLNEIKNRGVKDILIVSTDGLPGFKEAIRAVFPMCEIQRCIVHQIRNTIKHINNKDIKEFIEDLKGIYKAASEEIAMNNLIAMKDKWGKKYRIALKSWEENWDTLSTFFKYPEEIRKIMYTTNIIESLNRQYRKVTKSKCIYPTDDSLMKSLYLATIDVEKKWTAKIQNWGYVLGQLDVRFGERVSKYL
jgi:transposase-like protein